MVPRLIGSAILATGGWGLGEYIADTWGPQLYLPWVLGLTVGGVVLGWVATPFVATHVVRRLVAQTSDMPTSRVLSCILGLVLGLLVALLAYIPLARIPGWGGVVLPIAVSIFLAYLGAMLMASPGRDVFRRIVSDGAATRWHSGLNASHHGQLLLDTSAIIDGRIASISRTGFLPGTLLVPRFILDELQRIADSSDSLRRNRGRRGLEMLNRLRKEPEVPIEVVDVDRHDGQEVDSELVGLARELHASIITTDYNLNRVAQIQGVPVLNVNELANCLKPAVLPGEGMTIRIIQEGKEPGQGVGFLDDGTMVVVDSAQRYLNKDMAVLVTRVLQTETGSIVFAQLKRS